MVPFSDTLSAGRAEHSADQLTAFYQAAVANELPVALWRLPTEDVAHAIVDLSGDVRPAPIDFSAGQPSFVLSPFVDEDHQSTLHLRADVHLTRGGLRTLRELWNGQRSRFERFMADFRAFQLGERASAPAWYTTAGQPVEPGCNQADYRGLVQRAIEFISTSGLAKVVVSRQARAFLPDDFDPVVVFHRLCTRYANAFVSLVAVPGIGTWIGASPELLLADDGNALSTMALAGTQALPPNHPLASVAWSSKEIEEQALVSDYIRDFFQQAGVNSLEEAGPRTVAAGNVAHLRTDFRVTLPHEPRMALANRVLHELHPTSAVCGMPKDKALAFILQNEGYDRSFYSGFLGPMHVDSQSHLFVNLRCMRLDNRTASLYVGGGVTRESDPDAEWRETELKAETLLGVLRTGDSLAPAQLGRSTLA